MGYPQPPPFSPLVLLTLLLVVAASSVTFWLLVRRATSHRQWVALGDWARDKRFRFRRAGPDAVPAPLDALRPPPTVRLSLARGPTSLLQFEATGPAPAATPGTLNAPRRILWNVLTRELPSDWPATGLRPANATASLLDLFSLSSFPTLGATERFVAYGTDSAAARVVSKSMLRSLLPPDVGLLLHGRRLVLDFSDRPFDALEFGRMLALADQLAARLPAPPARS
jgi:hypothetical protein